MKQIAFLIVDNGADGRAPTTIQSAFYEEVARDKAYDSNKNRLYLGKSEVIIDPEQARRMALTKLNGLERLVLSLA